MTQPASERVTTAAAASIDLTGHVLGHVERLLADARRDARSVASEARALWGAAGSVREALRGVPRLVRILSVVGRIAASYRLHRARFRAAEGEREAAALEEVHRRGAQALYELCAELGGGVLKIGQFLSCRADLLPPAYVEALGRLRDRAPAVPAEEILDVIEEELGAPPASLFARIDPEPLATASLAQVHRAALADGTEAAVKVQLPGVGERVALDLAALRQLVPLVVDAIPGIDVHAVFAELARSVRAELDFEREAESQSRARDQLTGDERVVVPAVFPALSARRVLTMELARGEPLAEFLQRAGAEERLAVLETWVDVLCAQVLRHGLFHADPHPGNFLVSGEGGPPRIIFLDFGCVGRLDPEIRLAYARAAAAFLAADRDRAGEVLADLGFEAAGGDREALALAADALLEAFRDPDALSRMAADPRAALEQALGALRERPVARVPHHFVLLGRLFGAAGGLLLAYAPGVNLYQLLARQLRPA